MGYSLTAVSAALHHSFSHMSLAEKSDSHITTQVNCYPEDSKLSIKIGHEIQEHLHFRTAIGIIWI